MEYYERQRIGLGDDFRDEVQATLERIQRFPLAWGKLSANTRRCLMHHFPYGIIYSILESKIVVLAIAHLHREPEYWRES